MSNIKATVYNFKNMAVVPKDIWKTFYLKSSNGEFEEFPTPVNISMKLSTSNYYEKSEVSNSVYVFDNAVLDENSIFEKQVKTDIVKYVRVSDNVSLVPEISVEIFDKLGSDMQRMYTKQMGSTEEFLPVEVVVKNIDSEINIENIAESLFAGLSGKHVMEFDRVSNLLELFNRVSISGMGSLRALYDYMSREERVGSRSQVVFRWNIVEVQYYADAFDGSTRKILDTKRDGKPYADRRGRTVNDYGNAVSSLKLTEKDAPIFIAKNVKDLHEMIQDFAKKIRFE